MGRNRNEGLTMGLPEEGQGRQKTRWWKLVAAEPFRLLFPLGVLIGLVAVALWPLHHAGLVADYPAVPHARLMIGGFIGAFVAGFLGTAGPRLLDAPRFGLRGAFGLAALQLLMVVLYLTGHTALGDGMLAVFLATLVSMLGERLRARRDLPPPSFVLVGAGLLSGVIGAGIVAFASLGWGQGDYARVGQNLLYQAFPLLPTLGIGAFLFHRIFGQPNPPLPPDNPKVTHEWVGMAVVPGLTALALLGTWVAEGLGHDGAAWVRPPVMLAYGLWALPRWRGVPLQNTMALGLKTVLVAFFAGYLMLAYWPELRVAMEHIVFIGGFSLAIFVVATRVLFGHGGQSHRFGKAMPSLAIVLVLMLLAAGSRVGADWTPRLRQGHLDYAAYAWIAGALIWSLVTLPAVRHAEDE